MPCFKINNISIKGISACVPQRKANNTDIDFLSEDEINKFIEITGVESRRVTNDKTCTSDLCFKAADKLISNLKWNKNDINIVVFVSQTADYLLPITSAILQNKLGLSKECIAFDISLGCSGYVYGLSVISSFMSACKLNKGLLLVGDTISKIVSPEDRGTLPLFGDAGSATCLEYNKDATPFLFDLGTDGNGSNSIIVPSGGARNPHKLDSFVYREYESKAKRNDFHLILEGMDVFSFGITQVPKTVKKTLEAFSLDIDEIDYFVFHQANKMMNSMIAKKLKLPSEKVPTSLKYFGNTSSASIPLTIVTQIKSEIFINRNVKMLLCGFGVGLSWGTLHLELSNTVCLELIEFQNHE